MNQEEFELKVKEIHERVLSKALSPEEENNYTESLFESIKHINEYGYGPCSGPILLQILISCYKLRYLFLPAYRYLTTMRKLKIE